MSALSVTLTAGLDAADGGEVLIDGQIMAAPDGDAESDARLSAGAATMKASR